ncbi:SEMA5 [Mytilus edulis]|uniref:Semaphorin-2A n=1 Tax=Mytilus edulis TaxID=6550 RepID=A0A8S3QGL6_MYTED|nr:SEMA5 [Mytilus edulis]
MFSSRGGQGLNPQPHALKLSMPQRGRQFGVSVSRLKLINKKVRCIMVLRVKEVTLYKVKRNLAVHAVKWKCGQEIDIQNDILEDQVNPSFPKEFDFRFTSYEDLLKDNDTFKTFQHEDLTGFVQLTVDLPRNQLIVGSRDILLRLDLDDLETLEKTEWKSNKENTQLCLFKGQTEETCHNFIRVVFVHGDSLFTCGTYAFKPKCIWRSAENLTVIEQEEFHAVGYCPFTPDHNSTAVLTKDKMYYSGTVLDIQGRDKAIYRPMGSRPLRTKQYNSKWLNDPDFVSAYEVDDHIYFFYREVAVEYINCGKRIYSRVARVCKSDKGGDLLFEDNWTTFNKARMNCSIPGKYPFYFDQIQSTYFLESGTEKYFFAIFTTSENSIAGSAVCIYNMTSFTNVFNGAYKYQENVRSAWMKDTSEKPLSCPDDSGTDKRSSDDGGLRKSSLQIMQAQKYQLMDDAIQPHTLDPLVFGQNERWTHLVVDSVKGKGQQYHVIFLATVDGYIRKMAYLPQLNSSCLIEEHKIVPNGDHKPVKNLRISEDKGAVYVTVTGKIIKIPVQRCDRFTDQDLCKNSMDPYCGWNKASSKCTTAPDNDPSIHYWMQDIISCPIVEHPIDGMWSEWSSWETCQQTVPDPSAGDCLCRTRSCDNPKPAFGGKSCVGSAVEVTNCTAHGQWTAWTAWSKCSITCGHNGTRSRNRYCSNPPPRYMGRDCIGSDRDEGYCPGNPSCPEPPVDGRWTVWSPWGDCTADCNGGIQTRIRRCSQPPPSPKGRPCEGNTQEWRMCNTLHCPEIARNLTKVGGWSSWQPWSHCSKDCGGGSQHRKRSCDNPQPMGFGEDCSGHDIEARQCNIHSCQGVWGCWSEYSVCSASCGHGSHVRVRRCDSSVQGTKFILPCKGQDTDYKPCTTPLCNVSAGWNHWSEWTVCGVEDLQYRHRQCQIDHPSNEECQGHRIEKSNCEYIPFRIGVAPIKEREETEKNYSLLNLIVVASGSFIFGIMLTIGLYLCVKSCRSFRKFDLEKERKKNEQLNNGKRKSMSSQLSLDFLTVNNKVFDVSSLQISKQDKFVSSKNSLNSLKRKEAMHTDLQFIDG